MLKIDLENMQAIGEAHIVIEDNSITEFTGDNSNGKSIVSKIIEALTSGDIAQKDVRRTLIKDGCDTGVAVFTHDKTQLGLILKPEVKDSIICYRRDIEGNPNDTITRCLNDAEALKNICHEFGFRTYAGGSICLQLHPTWGAIPFVTTSGAVNNEIVEDITIDKIADNFLKTYKTITYPIFKEKIKSLEKEKEYAQRVLDSMESYDWHAYDDIYNRMSEVYQAIRNYQYFEIDEVPIPNLSVMPVPHFSISNIPIINTYPLCSYVDSISDELDTYIKIMNGYCPTCGRPFVEH